MYILIERKALLTTVFFILVGKLVFPQVQPLSRQDSAQVVKHIESYDLYKFRGDQRTASEFLNKLAFIYWNHNQYQRAIDYYLESLNINRQLANENGVAMLNNNLGTLYGDLGKYDTALYYFEQTYGSRKANKQKIGMLSALINMSVVLTNLEQYYKAIEKLDEAIGYAIEINDLVQLRLCYGSLAEIYEKLGDSEKTLHYFDLYSTIYDKSQEVEIEKYEKEKSRLLIEKLKADTARKNKQIELLKKEQELSSTRSELKQTGDLLTEKDSLLTKEQLLRVAEEQKRIAEEQKRIAEEQRSEILKQQQFYQQLGFAGIILFLSLIFFFVYRDYRKTQRLNTILREKNERIERQKRDLEQANTIKDKLFSIVAHDLRSPFNTLISFFYILNEAQLPDDVKSIFSEIKHQLHNTSNLLDNLLYWAKSQMQDFEPSFQNVSLYDLATENKELLDPIANGKSIKIINSVPKELSCLGDKEMLKLVIRNLTQNAIKFTPDQGTIELSGFREFGKSVFEIRDSGIGMSEDKIDSLFRLKTNRSTTGTNNEKGTGLGLVLCHEFIVKNNGEMKVESKLNHGTKISFAIDQTV